MEDDTSTAVARWVAEENAYTQSYLDRFPYRRTIYDRIEKIYNFTKYFNPLKRQGWLVYSKNDGLQNQAIVYLQRGTDAPAEVVIDPNTFSTDGSVQLTSFQFSRDMKYVAYGISRGGSDWVEYVVMEVASRKLLADHIRWTMFSAVAWKGDGFYYGAYDAPKDTTKILSALHEHYGIYYHKLGTDQRSDVLVYDDRAHPMREFQFSITNDERFEILWSDDPSTGKAGNQLFVRNTAKHETQFSPIVTSLDDECWIVDNIGDKLLLVTTRNAPNGKLVLIDPLLLDEKNWKVILPEKNDVLRSVQTTGNKIIAVYMKDVVDHAYVFDHNGTLEREIGMPSSGVIEILGGLQSDSTFFYAFSSFVYPSTIYEYNLTTGTSAVYFKPNVSFDPHDYTTSEIFYPSKDGTRIPMFLVHKNGIKLDGTNPTLLYGYGGFNHPVLPEFSSTKIVLLEQGFVYASANIRGGSEYGKSWHESGMRLKKQNVFDDFIAGAEWLIAKGYTSPKKLAVIGGSNGGLLVGAVMTQRPELFKAAITMAGTLDMLRLEKFTDGAEGTAELGSTTDSLDFLNLYRYSPLQTIREGVSYPATLVTTSDHDDRVVPAHSYKFTAALQEKQASTNPILLRVETQSGHGARVTSKILSEITDRFTFLFSTLGVTPRYR
jgi:prolyl oligopeptidase